MGVSEKVNALEKARRRQRLELIDQIARVWMLEPERLEFWLFTEGLAGQYPAGLREAWAAGEISAEEWIEKLKIWAEQLVAANPAPARAARQQKEKIDG